MAARASVIAIDGPVGAGKTVVGRELARRLGFQYLDTGVMYRAVGWLAQRTGVPLDDEEALGELAESASIQVLDHDGEQVMVGEHRLGPELLSADVARFASLVAVIPRVRRAMVREQRAKAAEGRIVMVGRDIGTVVLPQADLKIFLTASAEERARRRWRQFRCQGQEVEFSDVLQETRARDLRDTSRADSPLLPAEDAVVLETDHIGVDQVVDLILEHTFKLSK